MTDFPDDITQAPIKSEPVPDRASRENNDSSGSRGRIGDHRQETGVVDPAGMRRQVLRDSGETQAMEVVNEDEGDEPAPVEPEAPTEPVEPTTPEEPTTPVQPTTPKEPLTGQDEYDELFPYDKSVGHYGPVDDPGPDNPFPDEVMIPIDENGQPIEGDSGFDGLDFS